MPGTGPISPYMKRALELARGVVGTTSPNPAVGAVLVKDGRVVGEGATQPPGGPHAEVVAIRDAGSEAVGAALFVTLEPCCVQGRTPPCTDAILEAGIREVLVAVGDPDPRANGRGIQTLRDAGVALRRGDGAEEARGHYEAYAHHRRTGRPFVIAKFAMSLDGKIAATSGDSRWVSSAATRAWAHAMRPTVDAILVGVDTVVVDDPQLTARPQGVWEGVPQPRRVVLDSRGRTPVTARVLQDQDLAATVVVTTSDAPPDWRSQIEGTGARVLELPSDNGLVALEPLLDTLGRDFGVVTLLVEGGGRVHGAFFDRRLVNKVHAVIAPMIIGGDAATAVAGRGAERMAEVLRLRDMTVERLGDDLLITGYPLGPRPAEAVVVRPAGSADLAGYAQLIADPLQRDGTESGLGLSFDRSTRGEGNVWVGVQDDAVVGGIALTYLDAGRPERVHGQDTATLEFLLVSVKWRDHGLAERLVEAAEASAAGRDFRWLTAAAGSAADPSVWSQEDWKRRGYRYYRRTTDGGVLVIKKLEPAVGLEGSRS